MKKSICHINTSLFCLSTLLLFLCALPGVAQKIRWLHVTSLQSPINEIGAEYETEFPSGNTNFFSWPAKYGIAQNTTRAKGLWIGSSNFYDPDSNTTIPFKVVASGSRDAPDRPAHIFPQEIKLIGKYDHPLVVVDEQLATINDIYDDLDEIDPGLPCDRMVIVKYNTSIGISVIKRVIVFAHPDHGNYFVNDYVFKNSGIYNQAGDIYSQTLTNVYFYFHYRHAYAGVTSKTFGSYWGSFESQWGENTIYHNFGSNYPAYSNPASVFYQLNGFFSYYGPSNRRSLSYAEDWGCPRIEDGMIGAAKYTGCVTLHADTDPQDQSNNINQPSTTWFVSPDAEVFRAMPSTIELMSSRYALMSEGHPDQPHSAYVGDDYAINNTLRNDGGGTSQGQGYGPYDLARGDSVHIVFAEGVNGLSWEECRRIGAVWEQHYSQGTGPEMILPDGTTTSDPDAYKRAWVETGADSILKTFNNAKANYESGYTLAMPPPPPEEFEVISGADAIKLRWSMAPAEHYHYNGFVIYRSEENVLDEETIYQKIFECDGSYNKTDGGMFLYNDTSIIPGPVYYYYIQTKSDGLDNSLQPGKPLYSSLFWTITSVPAYRMAANAIYGNSDALLSYKLYPNFPNPFNPSTTIKYRLKEKSFVVLTLYDINGREMKTLVKRQQKAGEHSVRFDAGGWASGIYIYKIRAGSFEQSHKMLLLQ